MAHQGQTTDAIMLNILLLNLFALFVAVSQCQLAKSISKNGIFFKKVRIHGEYNSIMYIDWHVCAGNAKKKSFGKYNSYTTEARGIIVN